MYRYTYVYKYMYVYRYMHMYRYRYMYMYVYVYMYTHTHTHARNQRSSLAHPFSLLPGLALPCLTFLWVQTLSFKRAPRTGPSFLGYGCYVPCKLQIYSLYQGPALQMLSFPLWLAFYFS